MDEVEKFNPTDWYWERSSGYSGYRNKFTSEWIYEEDYQEKKKEEITKRKEEKSLELIREVMDWERNLSHIQRNNIPLIKAKKEMEDNFLVKFRELYDTSK